MPLPRQPGDQHDRYRCKQNQKQLLHWEGHPENYAYPWRNNFCEARGGAPGSTLECPAGRGHQGQDIRASGCPGPAGADTCQTDFYEVIAVATGNACRDGNKIRLRFRYDGALLRTPAHEHQHDGRRANKGPTLHSSARKRVIGKVGNFQDVTGGTSTHLHIEIHPVDPLSRFNPYMTLIRAYERRIGALGTEITD